MLTLRVFCLFCFTLACYDASEADDASSLGRLSVNWPEIAEGVDSWLENDSPGLKLADKVQLPFFEGDRELLDFHEETGRIAVRTEEQQLILRDHNRATEIPLGGTSKIYGRASFTQDGERLIGIGARASDYSGLIDCYDTSSGYLLWSRDVPFVADKTVLPEGNAVLVTNYDNQHREGMVAAELFDARNGRRLDLIERVAYTKSSPLTGVASEDGKRIAYPSTDGILFVDTVSGTLRWIPEVARNGAHFSPDGRYLAFTSSLNRGPKRIIDLRGEHPPIDISSFTGFSETWYYTFDFLFSEDHRSFYVFSPLAGIEKWDFLDGKKLAAFSSEEMRMFQVVEAESRLFVLGNTRGGLENINEDRIHFLEYNALSGDLIQKKSWDQMSYSTSGSFGVTKVTTGLDMRLSEDDGSLELSFNNSRWKKEFDDAELVELEPDAPHRVRTTAYLAGKGVFRVLWSDGAVSDFKEDNLQESTLAWKNPLAGMGDRVMIDPISGHVAIRILYDVLVFDANTGQQIHQIDEPYDIEIVSELRNGGNRLLLSKKKGEVSTYGVYDLATEEYVFQLEQYDGYSNPLSLSPSGQKLVRLIPSQIDPWRNFEMIIHNVDTGEIESQLGDLTSSRAFAFSADEEQIVFATQYADGSGAPRWALKQWDLQTEEIQEALDLTPLGEIAEPSQIVFAGSSNAVLIRSKFDCLYTVDLESKTYSPIKYMRLGPIQKSEKSLRDQTIAASPQSYAIFDGRGRLEMGRLGSDPTQLARIQMAKDSSISLEPESDNPFANCRFIWSQNGSVWIDNEAPSTSPYFDLETLTDRLLRAVWQTDTP